MAAEKSAQDKIEDFLNQIELLDKVQNSLPKVGDKKIKKLYIAATIALVAILIILFGFGAALLCNFVAVVYPAYASFKSLENQDKDEHREWLTYWVVYSCFSLTEGFMEYVLFWVPFYYPIKLAFLFYLFLPQTKGAMMIYESFLSKALRPYVSMIDSAAREAGNKAASMATTIQGEAQGAMGKESAKLE